MGHLERGRAMLPSPETDKSPPVCSAPVVSYGIGSSRYTNVRRTVSNGSETKRGIDEWGIPTFALRPTSAAARFSRLPTRRYKLPNTSRALTFKPPQHLRRLCSTLAYLPAVVGPSASTRLRTRGLGHVERVVGSRQKVFTRLPNPPIFARAIPAENVKLMLTCIGSREMTALMELKIASSSTWTWSLGPVENTMRNSSPP